MIGSTTALESDEEEFVVIGRTQKRKFENDSDESEQSVNDAAVASASNSVPRVSKTMDKTDHIAIKSTRDRAVKHEGVKSVTIDPFSVALYRFINVTKELAIQDINGNAKTFKIPFTVKNGKLVLKPLTKSARTLLIETLKERMTLYDVGVSLDLVELMLDPAKWISFGNYYVCPEIGEVMTAKGKLIGSLRGNKIANLFDAKLQRSHVVLLASGHARPSDAHSADHIIPSQKLNDSISNLRWATVSLQNGNQDPLIATETFLTYTGSILPSHPEFGQLVELTSEGFVKVRSRRWSKGTEHPGNGDFTVQINSRQIAVHILMVECILGRLLSKNESVDHICGDHSMNILSNIAPVLQADNLTKAKVRLITRVDSQGNAVVFGGQYLAMDVTPGCDSGNITRALKGKIAKKHNSYEWKDSSEEDIDLFFSKMEEVDIMQVYWPEFADHPRYSNLLKSITLFQEWSAAISKYERSLL